MIIGITVALLGTFLAKVLICQSSVYFVNDASALHGFFAFLKIRFPDCINASSTNRENMEDSSQLLCDQKSTLNW